MAESESTLENWLLRGSGPPPEFTSIAGIDELGKGMVLAALHQRTDCPIVAVFSSRAEARNAIDNFGYFAGKKAGERAHYLPSVDFDYYRGVLPNPEQLCERNVALFHALNDSSRRVFVTTVSTLLKKAVPPSEFLRATRILKINDEVLRDDLLTSLLEAGYQRQPVAYDPGVFAVRGGVIDIFCPLYSKPIRIDFFGDFIEEIRFFDPQSQRSLDKLEEALVIPVGQSLVPHGDDYEKAAVKIKERLDGLGIPKVTREDYLEKVRLANLPTELMFLFPLLSGGSAPLIEYFPANAFYVWDGKEHLVDSAQEDELPKLEKNLELFEKAPSPVARRSELFISIDELKEWVANKPGIGFQKFVAKKGDREWISKGETISLSAEREMSKSKSGGHPALESFAHRFKGWMDEGYRIQIVSHTQTHSERIQMLFDNYGLRCRFQPEAVAAFPTVLETQFSELNLWQGYITQSQRFPEFKLIVLSEEEIFGQKKRAAKSSAWSAKSPSQMLSNFKDLKIGDYVVHKDQGIGRYLGLKSMNFLEVPNDYVLLEYKDGDKLYVPIYRLNVLQKYAGAEGAQVTLDKLGGERWTKAKQKAQRAVAELAAEFLNIQAKRKLVHGHAFSPPGQDFREFEMGFPFDETVDQLKAIEDVMDDMGKSTPMDRLICGDVGYGKTEVAMRAAYRAVLDRKQAAILVPTTVLAFQHFQNFKQRFKDTGARVEMVSRLRSSAEIKQTLNDLEAGKVDVIVGTHRLLSSDVVFKDLGLMVIDEEHRFGVVHKEKLKKMAEAVHVISMTATPIPRTLNMAMTGIKDISIITTPPPDRLSVRTFVCKQSDDVVAEAITNELARDGQVLFVHNRIESIFKVAENLKAMLPKLTFEIVHGQMEPSLLEKKMLSFFAGDFHCLITTAIIESGLDIPRANTIIIDDADHFGLAQLYQLRGRVGRSSRRAYCYLLVPPESQMTEDSKQRLQVIQRYTDLGAGFSVASHDLEIRGAGDLLGADQSGHLNAVGVDMYFDLLEESIQALRGQKKKHEIEPEISLKIAAFFPQDYIPDLSERVNIYRKLSGVETEETIAEIETEIRDRFGALPEEVINLLNLMNLKMHLKRLHVVKMSCGPKRTSLQFAPSTPASPAELVKLIQADPQRYALTPDQKLVLVVESSDVKALTREIQRLSQQLGVG